MLNSPLVVALSLALFFASAQSPLAQGRQTGTIRGTALDSTAAFLPGVTVTATSEALQGSRSTVTDVNGNYEIPGLPNGRYTVTFELEGFATVVERRGLVPLGGSLTIRVSMPLGALAEAIQVAAVVPSPLTSTESSQNITAEEIGRLPMGRTVFRIAELASGLTANTPERRTACDQRSVRLRQYLFG